MERLWHPGANYAADAVVVAEESVLLVQRRDTGLWALPGGFVDDGETSLEASRREVAEETGLELHSPGVKVYRGPVDDPRNSVDRWIESTAYLYAESVCQPICAKDEVLAVDWLQLASLPEKLHGSHGHILQAALGRIGLIGNTL